MTTITTSKEAGERLAELSDALTAIDDLGVYLREHGDADLTDEQGTALLVLTMTAPGFAEAVASARNLLKRT